MKKIVLFLLFAALLTGACKKKEVKDCISTSTVGYNPDTVYSSPYIMAWPGSSWTYDDGSVTTCDSWQQVGIRTSSYFSSCSSAHTTYTIVPHTSSGYIHNTALLSTSEDGISSYSMPVVADTLGVFYDNKRGIGSGQGSGVETNVRSVTELLDSMTVAGTVYYDVVHVHSDLSIYYYHVFNGPVYLSELYYARNVGLIRSEIQNNSDPVIVRNLVSYTIGPH